MLTRGKLMIAKNKHQCSEQTTLSVIAKTNINAKNKQINDCDFINSV